MQIDDQAVYDGSGQSTPDDSFSTRTSADSPTLQPELTRSDPDEHHLESHDPVQDVRRLQRLAALKASIEGGTYKVSANVIADSLIRHMKLSSREAD